MKRDRSERTKLSRFRGAYLGIDEISGWEYATRVNATGVVVIIAVTADEQLILVEQPRIPINAATLELPAGLVGDTADKDESLELAAERELLEETGYQAEQLRYLTQCPSSAGMTDETISFFLALDARRVGEGGGDDSEDITVHTVPLEEIDLWLADRQRMGTPLDPKIYAALYWLERVNELDAILP